MIPLFCPTKNRASQCRLMLESINRNAPGVFQPNILWKADPKYVVGYEKLMSEQWVKDMGTTFIEETDLIKQFYLFLANTKYLALFMDDCIFYNKFPDDAEYLEWILNDQTWCVSLRLGFNTVIQDYITGEMQQELIQDRAMNKDEKQLFTYYNFKDYHPHKNYGFHFSWDGVIYRSKDILNIFAGTDFTQTSNQWAIAPQRIENYMMNRRDQVPYKFMACPQHSYVVCMNWNCTHPFAKTGVKFGGGMEEMQELYMNDYVVDLDSIDFSNVKSCHEELSFTYRKI